MTYTQALARLTGATLRRHSSSVSHLQNRIKMSDIKCTTPAYLNACSCAAATEPHEHTHVNLWYFTAIYMYERDACGWPTWKKSSSANWSPGLPPACSFNKPKLWEELNRKMSAALRRLLGELKDLGEHHRFVALTETSVTSCATSLSHCLRLFAFWRALPQCVTLVIVLVK